MISKGNNRLPLSSGAGSSVRGPMDPVRIMLDAVLMLEHVLTLTGDGITAASWLKSASKLFESSLGVSSYMSEATLMMLGLCADKTSRMADGGLPSCSPMDPFKLSRTQGWKRSAPGHFLFCSFSVFGIISHEKPYLRSCTCDFWLLGLCTCARLDDPQPMKLGYSQRVGESAISTSGFI
jgi:hypothetical protein